MPAPIFGAGAEVPENKVKAACLLNLPRYVDWPESAFAATNSPILVTIVGDPGLADDFEKIMAGKTIKGHPLTLKSLPATAQVTNDCHILFISGSTRRTAELLPRQKNANTLTVGDEAAFLENGGMIRLVRRDGNIRLEVNLAAANRTELKISSKLLSLADVVKGPPK